MLDTYCGAGGASVFSLSYSGKWLTSGLSILPGLTLGLERGSGCIEVKYAVDIDADATKAFK